MNETVTLVDKIRGGDIRYIARLISMVENEDPSRIEVLKALHANTGKAHIVGITGPPGAGKSTLTDKIVGELRGMGKKVAVLAVDPSSPFSGGAILGDRIRMQRHATDSGVYIRSLATRGHLGGLSQAVYESARVLDASGFDTVIIETVGVGQSEVDIVRCADTIVLVSVPGLGDDIQAIKAGVMEIGDIFIVNKADKDGAERVIREIKTMLETAVMNSSITRFSNLFEARARRLAELNPGEKSTGFSAGESGAQRADAGKRAERNAAFESGAFHHIAAQIPDHPNLEIPPVLATVGETGGGVKELVEEIQNHAAALNLTGFMRMRREDNIAWELKDALSRQMLKGLEKDEASGILPSLAKSVIDTKTDFYDALARLAKALKIKDGIL